MKYYFIHCFILQLHFWMDEATVKLVQTTFMRARNVDSHTSSLWLASLTEDFVHCKICVNLKEN